MADDEKTEEQKDVTIGAPAADAGADVPEDEPEDESEGGDE